MIAVEREHLNSLQLLLQAGADTEIKDKVSYNALMKHSVLESTDFMRRYYRKVVYKSRGLIL